VPVLLRLFIVTALVLMTSGIPTALGELDAGGDCGSAGGCTDDDCGGGRDCTVFCGSCPAAGVVISARISVVRDVIPAPVVVETIAIDLTVPRSPPLRGLYRPPRFS
jgi:hypothetical protein